MLFHIMESRDIRENLATEYYIMNEMSFDEPVVLFYIQTPCVILGRNQNAYEEVDLHYLRENNITLTRRVSGGGAVYDDLGNVSFSFIVNKGSMGFGDFQTLLEPITTVLKELGLKDVVVDGRNDVLIGDRKISGNAMYTRKGKMFSHGTLLFDVCLDELSRVLTVSKEKLESKGTKSVRSRVTNIKEHLPAKYQELTSESFRDLLLISLLKGTDMNSISTKQIMLNEHDLVQIQKLIETVYGNDDWIFGAAPAFTVQRKRRFEGVGTIDVRWNVKHGQIETIRFLGDYFGEEPIALLETALIGQEIYSASFKQYLNSLSLNQYIKGLSGEQLHQLLTEQAQVIQDD